MEHREHRKQPTTRGHDDVPEPEPESESVPVPAQALLAARAELERRLRILLPPLYEVFDDAVKPVSMGSAGLRFGTDGRVEWDRMWASFCDLAMAGGPPHRGTLLAPDASDAESPAYAAVAAELCRGLGLVTGLCAERAPTPGSVRLYCPSAAMAGWLVRAITMENVFAQAQGLALDLPCGAGFRVEKEIKNVITVAAKTCHYWQEHLPETQQSEVATLLRTMDREAPLLTPGSSEAAAWNAHPCASAEDAIWRMRALSTLNILARREGTTLFVPANPQGDLSGRRVCKALAEVESLARSTPRLT